MPYEFFLSYTRANNDPYLRQFVDALSEGVRDRRGADPNATVGYFDQREIELGEDWDHSIVEALRTCQVFVPILSPAYFKSDYCGREWALFRQRCAASGPPGSPLPPLIKPIVWIPFKLVDAPDPVRTGQFTFGDPLAVQNARGFKYLLKQLQERRTEFNDLVESLTQEIVDAADKYTLPPLGTVPHLRDVLSAFQIASFPGGGSPAAPTSTPTGPKHVRFVYVAADPHAFGNARRPDPYVDTGGGDWRPFLPDITARVHRLVQSVVANDDLDFTSDELPFSANLLHDIDEAWERRQIVVLIVDGWSVRWSSQYRAVLKSLDGRLDYHWCVLVPRNDRDQDAVAVRAEIDAAISQTFDKHANFAPNPMFFRAGIGSADELRAALRDVLTRLKEEIKKRAPVAMPVPAGPSKAVLTGPSAQG